MATIISHTITLLFGIFLILFVISLMSNIRTQYKDFIVENEIEHVCFLIKEGVSKIYVTYNIPGIYNETLGSINVRLPERIADTKYKASFFNSSVKMETFFDTRRNMTCVIGFAGAYKGLTSGGMTSITLYQYSNGTKVIEMKNI